MLQLLKPASYTQSLFLFQLPIFNFKFLFSQQNAVWENRLCTIPDGAGCEQWCSLCESIPQQSRQVQAIRSIGCQPIRRAPHLGHRVMPTTKGLWTSQSIPVSRFHRSTSHVSRGHHAASNKSKSIQVSPLSVLRDNQRMSMSQSYHLIINHQREIGGSPRGSRWSHDKLLGPLQFSRVLVGEKEECCQHVHLNARICLP